MKKSVPFLVLSVIPVLLIVITFIFKRAIGEYYLSGYYDPSYAYLVNSLNLAQLAGYGVGHIDHPGTTVQSIGALVIRIFHLSRGNVDISDDVFANPEYYLFRIFSALALLNFAASWICGFMVYKGTGSFTIALLLQSAPLYAGSIFYDFTNVSPEPLLAFSALILSGCIVYFLNRANRQTTDMFFWSIIFGTICGFGLASKTTFLPLLIIPFTLISGLKYKLYFLLFSLLALIVFVYPALSSANAIRYSVWLKNLVTHSGKYGSGAEELVDESKFLVNIKKILQNNVIFAGAFLTSFLVWIYLVAGNFRRRFKDINFRLLTAILAAMTIQLIIVGKHFELHYMIPSVMLSALAVYAALMSFHNLKFPRFSVSQYILISGVAVVFIFQGDSIYKQFKYFKYRKAESRKMIDDVKNLGKNKTIVTSYGSSSKEFASYYGSFFGGSQSKRYGKIVSGMYPGFYYFDKWNNKFYDTEDSIKTVRDLSKEKNIYYTDDSELSFISFTSELSKITGKNITGSKELDRNFRGEAVYEITLSPKSESEKVNN